MKAAVIAATAGIAVVAVIWLTSGSREPSSRPDSHASTTVDRNAAVARRVEQLSEQGRTNLDGLSPSASGRMRVSKSLPPAMRKRKPAPAPEEVQGQDEPADEVENPQAEFESLKEKALTDEDPDERANALSSLSSFDDQPVIPVLIKALSDRDPEVRLAALHELDMATDEPPLDALEFALADADPEVRLEALKMVGESDDERAKFLVQRALADPDEDVRLEAHYIAGVDVDEDS